MRSSPKTLFVMMGIAALLRVFIALHGGQYMWPDENRYRASQAAVAALMAGDISKFGEYSFSGVFSIPPYWASPGIIWAGYIPAFFEHLTGENPAIPAVFYGLFSVAGIYIFYFLLIHAGASRQEALAGAFFLAITNSYFYYARHLLTYDVSLTLCMLAVLTGIKKPESGKNAFLCGVLACLGFLTYNGYWVSAGLALLVPFIYRKLTIKNILRQSMCSALGMLLPLGVIIIGAAALRINIIKKFLWFSSTVKASYMYEGWSHPFEYYWHSEHFLFIFFLVAIVYALVRVARGHRERKVVLALFGICCIYATLTVFSVFLEQFLVYARTARQLTPYLCMPVAFLLGRLLQSPRTKKYALAIIALCVVQAGINFYKPLTITFADDFENRAEALVPEGTPFSLLYVRSGLLPKFKELPSLPPHKIVLVEPGPQDFMPYTFEGFAPCFRKKIKNHDVRFKLIVYTEPLSSPMPKYLP